MKEQWKGFNIPINVNNNASVISIVTLAVEEYGAKVLRAQLTDDPSLLPDMTNHAAYRVWLDAKLDALEVAADTALAKGAKIIIAQFQPFGGVETNSFGGRRHRIFTMAEYATVFYNDWAYIADRFKNHNGVLGYDLINEPLHSRMKKIMPVCLNTARIIREKNPTQKIIFSTPFGNPKKVKSFRRWVPQMKEIRKCWITVHMYQPSNITHQGLPDASCNFNNPIGSHLYPSRRWNRQKLANFLQYIKDFQRAYRVPIFIGEFSCTRWSGHPHERNAYNYLKDLMSIMDGHRWHWTYHAFMEAGMWRLDFSDEPCFDVCNPHCFESVQVTDRVVLMKDHLSR
jgi:hypothetical protein